MESGEKDLLSKQAILSLPRDVEKSLDGKILDEYINVKDIEALPTIQPVATDTNVGDTISRRAVIDVLKKFKPEIIPYEKARSYVEETIDTIYNRIEELPSVQPERKKGQWIEIGLSNHTYKCSVCGRLLVNITDGKNNVAKNYPYCHCGADMRGEQDG